MIIYPLQRSLRKTPAVEKAGTDEFYLDTTGMDKFCGSYKLTDQLARTIIKETEVPRTFAIYINKTVSKIGTQGRKTKTMDFCTSKKPLII